MSIKTVKRRSLCFTKETLRLIDDLCEQLGENPSQVMSRSIQVLYCLLNQSEMDKRDENALDRDV